MRAWTLVMLLAATFVLPVSAAFADDGDEDHPFGARPPKDAPVDNPFLEKFAPDDDQSAPALRDKADEPRIELGENLFATIPAAAFKIRPDVRPDDVKAASEKKPVAPVGDKPKEAVEPYVITLDLNGDRNISDAEVLGAIEVAVNDSKSRGPLGDRARATFDKDDNGKVEPMEAAEVIVARRVAEDDAASRVAETFVKLDTDRNGSVDQREFLAAADEFKLPEVIAGPILRERFGKLDRNHDEQVSFVEAILSAEAVVGGRGGASQADEAAMARATDVLNSLDRDENKEISRREASRNNDLLSAFVRIDTDKSDSLTLGEMYDFLQAQAKEAAKAADRAERREEWEKFRKGIRGRD